MKLKDILKNSEGTPPVDKLIIIGVNPLIEEMTSNPELFFDILNVDEKNQLKVTIFYESETENFNQSLFYNKGLSKNRIEFEKLQTYRSRLIGGSGKSKRKAGFIEDVLSFANENSVEMYQKRIKLLQNNLRHNINIILVDDVIWYSFTTLELPSLDMYIKITKETDKSLYSQLESYISFLMNENMGGIFLSKQGDELIELYDRESFPRGIYPRKAFYSTDYQRYSIWAFVFNRNGELLLHQRSATTKDNRLLWDKSAGGHVDLIDSSTIITLNSHLQL